MISVLVVNLNNLKLTKDCISDLLLQDIEFDLTIVDQNSVEEGTDEFLETVYKLSKPIRKIDVIRNKFNKSLNLIWNEFVNNSKNEYICLLNNDVRLCPNFLSSAIEVFQNEPEVGFVNHVTNNSKYKTFSIDLQYVVIDKPYRQGWDPMFRKSCYSDIAEQLAFFYGDDYIYSKLYSSGMKGAYIINSPIAHLWKQTTEKKGGCRDLKSDEKYYLSLDLEHKNLDFVRDLSKLKPEFDVDEFCKTVRYYNLLRNF